MFHEIFTLSLTTIIISLYKFLSASYLLKLLVCTKTDQAPYITLGNLNDMCVD